MPHRSGSLKREIWVGLPGTVTTATLLTGAVKGRAAPEPQCLCPRPGETGTAGVGTSPGTGLPWVPPQRGRPAPQRTLSCCSVTSAVVATVFPAPVCLILLQCWKCSARRVSPVTGVPTQLTASDRVHTCLTTCPGQQARVTQGDKPSAQPLTLSLALSSLAAFQDPAGGAGAVVACPPFHTAARRPVSNLD